jgi:hypothetical protein
MKKFIIAFTFSMGIGAAEAGPEATSYIQKNKELIKETVVEGVLKFFNKRCVGGGCKAAYDAHKKGESFSPEKQIERHGDDPNFREDVMKCLTTNRGC